MEEGRMEVVKTGIPNFDRLFAHGGYPVGNTVLLLGGPGCGKSIYGAQFLYSGAVDENEPGILVTLHETPQNIRRNLESFGWDIEKLEAENKLVIIDAASGRVEEQTMESNIMAGALDVKNMLTATKETADRIGAKRLVIDSLSVLGILSKNDFEARTKLLQLSGALAAMGITSLVISEARTVRIGTKEFPVETFMVDGVVIMRLHTETQERKINIRKMRGTKHAMGSFKFEISDTGIDLKN
jgi:KaiC/GvpD/RAD55 family RecA-like ATPase